MKAVVITRPGGPDVLEVEERPMPKIGPEEVLIKVMAAGINRPDVFQRQGKYPAPEGVIQDVPGLEVAGLVVGLGDKCSLLEVGDRVMVLVSGGGYAEYVAADEKCCIILPDILSFIEAAGMPETLFTVWHNVFERGRLSAGERFLVHGGSGGIGSTAIQLAHLSGARVYTTVGSLEKARYVKEIGADNVLTYGDEDFEHAWNKERINVILDSIGGEYFNKNIHVLAEDGRLVVINAMNGPKVELNLMKVMQKRIYITGSTLRGRSLDFKRVLTDQVRKSVMPWVQSGVYRTYIAQTFPFQDAYLAHGLMESRAFQGKIILTF